MEIAAFRRSFAPSFIALLVNCLPHTLQNQTTTQSVSTSPARLGCHFFDISLPHALQITKTPVSQLPQVLTNSGSVEPSGWYRCEPGSLAPLPASVRMERNVGPLLSGLSVRLKLRLRQPPLPCERLIEAPWRHEP